MFFKKHFEENQKELVQTQKKIVAIFNKISALLERIVKNEWTEKPDLGIFPEIGLIINFNQVY